mmetsp:Transcript_135038/g.248435  ORF Transcript_135038/g.248435 Transcript_135038/m.248435 type:complete len:1058 (-) Transcript_135038:77-3250(-)
MAGFLNCSEVITKCNEVGKRCGPCQPEKIVEPRGALTGPPTAPGQPTSGLNAAKDAHGDPLFLLEHESAPAAVFSPDPRPRPGAQQTQQAFAQRNFEQAGFQQSVDSRGYDDNPQMIYDGNAATSSAFEDGGAQAYGGFKETGANLQVPGQKGPPAVSLGFKEAMRPAPVTVTGENEGVQDQDEPEPEQEQNYSEKREFMKCSACFLFVLLLIVGVLVAVFSVKSGFDEPVCYDDKDILRLKMKKPKSCEPCGTGTLALPLGGEWEKDLNKTMRMIFYFLGLMWCFLGVAIICDQFMAAIEEITSTERCVWIKIAGGSKHKFHVRVWNATVANLTLMALGSSAPEILLSVIELMSDKFFAGELGPSTIVGSAAFNLLVITAVCVSAIPAPDIRKIDQTDVFAVTASVSIIAYVWLLIMLQVRTPNMVEPWEALATFLMFPALVGVAFAADRGYFKTLCPCRKPGKEDAESLEEEQRKLQVKYGKSISMTNVKIMMEANREEEKRSRFKSKAQYRQGLMQSMSGGAKDKAGLDEVLFGFKDYKHVVLECAGFVELKVVASRQPGVPVSMRFYTRDGQAKAGVRYEHREGLLAYEPHETEKTITIPIIDNETWEAEEEFTVELANLEVGQGPAARQSWFPPNQSPSPKPMNGKIRIGIPWTSVWVLNDDEPGMLSFAVDEVMACQGVTSVAVGVSRTSGTTGRISCHYETQEDSALASTDYTHVEGTLEFDNGQANHMIEIPILKPQPTSLDKKFRVILDNASPGVKFDPLTDGGDSSAICEVILPGTGQGACWQSCVSKCSAKRWRASFDDWKEQFPGALYCGGDAKEQAAASASDWFFHGLALFWKAIFALTPPARLGGGWPCFFWALGMIGCVTAIVGDMAKLLGCCVGIPDDITAITLVALGTSLPDTFASRTAARHDDCADNSIGNVTGSNSVNVFLGLGLPWSVGAFVWNSRGPTSEWKSRIYKGKTFEDHGFFKDYPDGGFIVPAGSLAFSVLVFVACAGLCLLLLIVRRIKYGGELGGPQCAQTRDMTLLVCLWFLYIACSIINSLANSDE